MKTIFKLPVRRSMVFLACGWFICTMSIGCAVTGSQDRNLSELTQSEESRGIYVMEYQGNKSSGEMKEYPLVGDITVQQALEKAGMIKKVSTCELTLIRTVPGTQRRHKMKLEFLSRSRQVTPEHNYALHPNDHLVIAHVSQNPLEAMLPGVLTTK